MRDGKRFVFYMLCVIYNGIDHFHQCFVDAARLIELYDIAFRCGSHNRFDLKRGCNKCFCFGKAPVFPQRFEIFQHKIGMLCADVEFYCLNYTFKAHTGFFTLHDFFHNQCLTDGCTSGIKHMNFQVLIFFLCQVGSKHCTVIGSAELCGKRYRIAVLCPVQKCRAEILRRRACGFWAFRALRHFS